MAKIKAKAKKCFSCFIIFCLLLPGISIAEAQLPQLFLFFGHDKKLENTDIIKLTQPFISGTQIVYTWRELEPEKDRYDFSRIQKDLLLLNSLGKKLFVQLQDRSFQPDLIYVPDYIKNEPEYHGGVAMQLDFPGEGKPLNTGWVARVWDPAVQLRFHLLLKKLGEKFDGKIYGINLPETAVDFDPKHLPEGFTNDRYFQAELENIGALKKAFNKSIVLQYINFFPGEWDNDHHYMERFFEYAIKNNIGLGGPDALPYRKGQMKNSYPFFHNNIGKIAAVGMAIQEPDYTYKNPKTGQKYKFVEFYSFAKEYLGASILFWNVQEPFFSNELMPAANHQYFQKANALPDAPSLTMPDKKC